jgi:hypothetical protein
VAEAHFACDDYGTSELVPCYEAKTFQKTHR